MKKRVAIIGSGNIGTDLMIKILNRSSSLEMAVMVGIDPESDGLSRARELGVETTHEGIDGLMKRADFTELAVVFDATSASAHHRHAELLGKAGIPVIDMTPAAIGPYVVPVANLDQHLDAPNINLVTCGGQATIPIVWAVNEAVPGTMHYAEIVASISSRSAGPGTRANIDEFTRTTAEGIEVIGGAKKGKAIIILNPADPPLIMRDTVYTFVDAGPDEEAQIVEGIENVVSRVAEYVPGYRLVKPPIFEWFNDEGVTIPGFGTFTGVKVTTMLEVEGAGDYLPAYAGNLDIMTSAALKLGEGVAR